MATEGSLPWATLLRGADGLHCRQGSPAGETRVKDAAQARAGWLGRSRRSLMDASRPPRQTGSAGWIGRRLRDWVIRFNDQGPRRFDQHSVARPAAQLNTMPPGVSRASIVEEVRSRPIHGVVRWRACDLIMRLVRGVQALCVRRPTIYRALKDLGFSHVSARPKAYKHGTREAMEAFKKTFPHGCGGNPREARAAHTGRECGFQDEMRVGRKTS